MFMMPFILFKAEDWKVRKQNMCTGKMRGIKFIVCISLLSYLGRLMIIMCHFHESVLAMTILSARSVLPIQKDNPAERTKGSSLKAERFHPDVLRYGEGTDAVGTHSLFYGGDIFSRWLATRFCI